MEIGERASINEDQGSHEAEPDSAPHLYTRSRTIDGARYLAELSERRATDARYGTHTFDPAESRAERITRVRTGVDALIRLSEASSEIDRLTWNETLAAVAMAKRDHPRWSDDFCGCHE